MLMHYVVRLCKTIRNFHSWHIYRPASELGAALRHFDIFPGDLLLR